MMPWLRERRADAGRFSRRDNAEVAHAAEAGTFRLPERRDETGLRRAVRVAFRRAGIGTRVRRMPCRRNRKTVAEREFCADTC